MNIQIRSAIVLVLMTTFLVSCGGSKRVIKSTPKVGTVTPPKPKPTVPEVIAPEPTPKSLPVVSYKDKVQNYIYEYSTIAKSEMAAYGIPASITLAQGILESGAGYGQLTQNANNHFGIKCHNWTGERVYHDDDKAQECFRKYDKASASFKDHSLFLKNRKRYAKLFTYRKNNYKAWARGLKAAGYATDPKYPAKLISIIERYKLYTYDEEVLGAKSPKTRSPSIVNQTPEQTSKPSVSSRVLSSQAISVETHIVQKGETLYSIAQQYNSSVAALKSYNNLSNNTIAVRQVLKVTLPKQTTSAVEHIVQKGETLYSIAQQYNSTVGALKSYNNLSGNSISIGQALRVTPTTAVKEDF